MNILFFIIFFIFIFMIIIMYCIYTNLTSTIIEAKWDIRNWISNAEARLMGEILINKSLLKRIDENNAEARLAEEILINKSLLRAIDEKVDKLNIKAIEEKEVDIKAGDEIVDENNDFYFVTYVYGDKVDGISKDGIVREEMEMGKVKKTGKKGVVCIKQEMPNWV